MLTGFRVIPPRPPDVWMFDCTTRSAPTQAHGVPLASHLPAGILVSSPGPQPPRCVVGPHFYWGCNTFLDEGYKWLPGEESREEEGMKGLDACLFGLETKIVHLNDTYDNRRLNLLYVHL